MSTEIFIADAICSHFIRCISCYAGNVYAVKVRLEGENATAKEEKQKNIMSNVDRVQILFGCR